MFDPLHNLTLAAEARLVLAMRRSDVAELDALLHERLVFVGPDGGLLSKQEDLELHRSGQQRIFRLDIEDQRIEVHDPVAAVSVVATLAGVFKGQEYAGRLRYLRLWTLTPQRPQVIAGSVCVLGRQPA